MCWTLCTWSCSLCTWVPIIVLKNALAFAGPAFPMCLGLICIIQPFSYASKDSRSLKGGGYLIWVEWWYRLVLFVLTTRRSVSIGGGTQMGKLFFTLLTFLHLHICDPIIQCNWSNVWNPAYVSPFWRDNGPHNAINGFVAEFPRFLFLRTGEGTLCMCVQQFRFRELRQDVLTWSML